MGAAGSPADKQEQPSDAANEAEQSVRHSVFAACGASGAKSRRVEGPPNQQSPAAHAPPPGGDNCDGDGPARREVYAGGAVDGEVCMGGDEPADGDLLSQAAAALGREGDDL